MANKNSGNINPYKYATVLGHWFYLLCNGGSSVNNVGNSYTVLPISMDTALFIVYNSLYKLTTTATLESFKNAVFWFTAGHYGLSSNTLKQVYNAFYAVNLLNSPILNQAYCESVTTLTASSGSIEDGSGMVDYGINTNCSWVIKPTGATSIVIKFDYLNTEQGKDTVTIYSGNNSNAPRVGVYSGTTFPDSILVNGSEAFITFKSNATITNQGWSISYKSNGAPSVNACSGTQILTASSGTFSDGSGSGDYVNNMNCSWLIAPSGATTVTLNFLSFNTELNYDFVKVYNGADIYAPLLGSFSGGAIPSSLTANSGKIYVVFSSDGRTTSFGWTASYSATGITQCTGTTFLTANSGSFSDGSGNNEYQNRLNCSWLIQPPGATSIILNFNSFDVEFPPIALPGSFYDYVKVFDGVSENAPLLGTFAGDILPPSIESSSGNLFVVFYTDGRTTAQGWNASYTSKTGQYCSGTTNLTASKGTFTDGSGSNNYLPNSDCQWLINPQNATSIELSFESINIGEGDAIIIYDGNSINSSIIVRLNGYQLPNTIISSSGEMLVRFLSDGTNQEEGFEASYSANISGGGSGYSMTGYEYWFDEQHQVRNFVKSTNREKFILDAKIPVSHLSSGVHTIHIKFIDRKGDWSSVLSSTFYKGLGGVYDINKVSEYEYWFDDDTTKRNQLDVNNVLSLNLNTGIDVEAIAAGVHVLNIRFKDSGAQWSSVLSNIFYKGLGGVHGINEISEYEYWFDDATTDRKRVDIDKNSIFNLNTGIKVEDLVSGVHVLNIRFKDSGEQWSSVISNIFYKGLMESNSKNGIAAYEYWFNDSTNNRQLVPLSGQSILLLSEGINTFALRNGVNSIHIRFQDKGKQWSGVVSQLFYKNGQIVAKNNKIYSYRYWFDSNTSNIRTTVLPQPINSYLLTSNININTLSPGKHTIHFQFQDSIHSWSGVTTDTFNIPLGVVANFTASDTVLCNPGTIQFTNQSINANSYQWSFGDGGTSTLSNPTKSYSTSGLYSVRLIAISADGERDTLIRNQYIKVGRPDIAVSPTQTICVGNTAILTASGAYTYLWSPSNGLNQSTGAIVQASPSTSTTYRVIGSDEYGCKDTATVLITVNPITSIAVEANSLEICPGDTVQLSATGNNNIKWLPSAGLLSQVGASVKAVPNMTTTYYAVGSGSCGPDTAQITIVVKEKPIVLTSDNISACLGKAAVLKATGASSYFWNTGSTASEITVSPEVSTTYNVIGITNGCKDTASIFVEIHSLPNLVLSDATICLGSSVELNAGNNGSTYLWQNGSKTQSITVTEPGIYSVFITNQFGCSIVDTALVEVSDSLQVDLRDAIICEGKSTVLDAGYSGATYQWSTGANTQMITVNTAGVYSVLVTNNATGCKGTGLANISIAPLTESDAGIDQTICKGKSIKIGTTAISGNNYEWSPSLGLNDNRISSPIASPTQNTIYILTVTSEFGCISKDTVQVNVDNAPVSVLNDASLCEGSTVTLDAGNLGATYLWQDGTTNRTLNVSESGWYHVEVSYGQCTLSDSVYIQKYLLPKADAGNDTIVCAGSALYLEASGGEQYSWSTGQLTPTIYITPQKSEEYIVRVTDSKGCVAYDSVNVEVNNLPEVTLSSFGTICSEVTSFELFGGLPEGGNYSGMGISDNILYPFNLGTGTHLITYTYIDNNGCSNQASESISIDVCTGIAEQEQSKIEIYPNPNNGIFYLKISNLNESVSIRILNISGQVIYTDQISVNKEYLNTFDISRFSAGSYIVNISYSGKSESIAIEKIN
jgi:PKD repeat protein